MFFSLRNRIFLIFTLLLTVPFLVLSILIPNWFTDIIEDETKNKTLESMDQYSLYLQSVTVQAEDLGKQVLVNQNIQQWLKLEEEYAGTNDLQRWVTRNELRRQLSNMVINNSYGMFISIFLNNGTGIWVNHPLLSEMDWYKQYSEENQRWVKVHTDPYENQTDVNSYLIPLFNINTLQLSGVIKVNFTSNLLEGALQKIKVGESGRVYLLTNQGENVLSGEIETPQNVLDYGLEAVTKSTLEQGLLETVHNGEDYLIFYQKLSKGNWILFSEITKRELFHHVNALQKKLLLISGIIFILTIIATYLLSTNIVSPLRKLTDAMRFLERGDFVGAKKSIPQLSSNRDEVGYLVKVFDQTIDKLRHLINVEYESNLRRKDAEYKALLLQINPHFMNNTLEIIGGLAAQGKNKEVINVSVYLGRMMRYSLNTHSDEVTLGEEINYIRNFTDILKVRYEENITIEINENPETKSLPIIKFIIQPLVENSVKYSFIENATAFIRIATDKIDDQIIISIEDNGIGMSSEMIQELEKIDFNRESKNLLASKGSSIGLRNVLGRLKLYYGEQFSFNIYSEKNKGTKIVLMITNRRGNDVKSSHN